MSPEIWFFFTPDGSGEISVLNRESARQVVQLMNAAQRQQWRVRKNRWPEALVVADCAELVSSDAKALAQENMMKEPARVAKAPAVVAPALALKLDPQVSSRKDDEETQIYIPEKGSAPAPAQAEMRLNPALLKNSLPTLKLQPDSPKAQVMRHPAPAKSSSFNGATIKNSEKRKHPRFDLRLRVVVISGNRSFRSFSRNISRGGLFLEHVIPLEFLDRPCRVIIGSTDLKENIEFDARLAGDPSNPRAMEFFEGQDFFVKKLDSWIDSMRKAGTGSRFAS